LMIGYPREDLLAGHIRWDELTPPEYHDANARAVEQLVQLGICPPFEKEYIRKDGSRIPVLVGATLLADSKHECVTFVLDITERKRADEEKARLLAQVQDQTQRIDNLVTNVPGVVWEAWGQPDEAAQSIDYVSDFIEEMLGYTVSTSRTLINNESQVNGF
jgi:PAS domain S-box-containing protein